MGGIGTRCQQQGDLTGEFPALILPQHVQMSFQRRHDGGPIVAMARDGFAHPTIKHGNQAKRGHFSVFRIEQQLKIESAS
jgi:hypothetical protein